MNQIPPQFTEGERAILGGCLLDNGVVPDVLDAMDSDDFYFEGNRKIFEGIQRLSTKRLPVDLQTLTAELMAMGCFEQIGGSPYLVDLVDAVPSVANLKHYIGVVKEKATLRSLCSLSRDILAKAMVSDAEASKLTDELQRAVFLQMAKSTGKATQIQHISEVLIDSMGLMENVHKDVIFSGFRSVDRITQGFFRGDLIIGAGRPSMGKTSWAAQVARNVAAREPVLVRSLEMPNKQLGIRYLAGETGLNLKQLRSGMVGPSDWSLIQDAAGKYSDLQLYFDESPRATVESVYHRARQLCLKLNRKLGLLVIDYLQLMITKEKYDKDVTKLEAMTRGLKLLARELDCPVIVLSQLNRDLEKRELWVAGKPLGKRPQIQDLRGSGSIEQDADTIIFFYRPDYYLERADDPRLTEWKGKAEALVAKQRNGNIGIARLMWNGPTTTFHDPENLDESKYMEAM